MITVEFKLDPANGVEVVVRDGPQTYGNGSMTLAQFRNIMPAGIRTAVRSAIDAQRTTLLNLAGAAASRASINADQTEADSLAAQAAALDQFTP